MLIFTTLGWLYLRYCLIVLVALSGFMVGFDVMQSVEKLPPSANLIVLYVLYRLLYAINMMLPLSLIFGAIVTLVSIIRSNMLAALYALGYSQRQLLLPFLVVAGSLSVIHIGLHATDFARANELADNLQNNAQLSRPTSNLFFTHENNFVYFGNLYPLSKRAEEIQIFQFNDAGELIGMVRASEAIYDANHWQLKDATRLRSEGESFEKGFVIEHWKSFEALPKFKPKILDQVYEGRVDFTIKDGFDALKLLKAQKVNVEKIQVGLYRIFITPWFALLAVILIFVHAPLGSRFLNLSFFSFGMVLVSLMGWGLLFMLAELAQNKTLSPFMGVIAPIMILAMVVLWRLREITLKSRTVNL